MSAYAKALLTGMWHGLIHYTHYIHYIHYTHYIHYMDSISVQVTTNNRGHQGTLDSEQGPEVYMARQTTGVTRVPWPTSPFTGTGQELYLYC